MADISKIIVSGAEYIIKDETARNRTATDIPYGESNVEAALDGHGQSISTLETDKQDQNDNLDGLSAIEYNSANGIVVQTAAGTFTTRRLFGTADQVEITNANGASNHPIIGIPTGAAGLMRPATTAVTYDAELAPAIASWTGEGSAAWSGSAWVIPAKGTIKANVDVVSGDEYQIAISRSSTNTYNEVVTPMLVVSLGAVVSDPQFTGYDDALYKLTLVANATGTVELKLGDGVRDWAASITNVSVKKVTARVTKAGRIGVGSFNVYTGGTNFAIGDGHQKRTSGDANTAIGYQAQNNITVGSYNNAIGAYAQTSLTTGLNNIAIGYTAQRYLKSGYYNIGIGYSAQSNLAEGSWNVGIGNECQRDLTTGHRNTSIGSRAYNSLTTGCNNVAIGRQAGFAPKYVEARKTTTASNQVLIGMQTGQSSTTQADNLTSIGYRATGTTNATAIGANTEAHGAGSVAIGMDSAGNATSTTVENEIKLGTVNHTIKIIGKLNLLGIATEDPRVAGQIWSNSGVLTVSAG